MHRLIAQGQVVDHRHLARAFQHVGNGVGGYPRVGDGDGDLVIEIGDPAVRGHGLAMAHVARGIDRLALQVGQFHRAIIDQRQPPHARARQILQGRAADAAKAAADAAAGEKVFGKCKACHKVDGANGTGPHLNGVVNRARGGVEGFGYSDGMKSVTDPWSPEALNAFLENPKGYVPGTKMSFAGLAKVEDRANVIAYLATLP